MERYGAYMINLRLYGEKDILNLIFLKLKTKKNTNNKNGLFYLAIL